MFLGRKRIASESEGNSILLIAKGYLCQAQLWFTSPSWWLELCRELIV